FAKLTQSLGFHEYETQASNRHCGKGHLNGECPCCRSQTRQTHDSKASCDSPPDHSGKSPCTLHNIKPCYAEAYKTDGFLGQCNVFLIPPILNLLDDFPEITVLPVNTQGNSHVSCKINRCIQEPTNYRLNEAYHFRDCQGYGLDRLLRQG